MANLKKKERLGMGLSGLFGEKNQNLDLALKNLNSDSSLLSEDCNENQDYENNLNDSKTNQFFKVDLKLIKPCKNQPRKHFDMDSLKELSDSIQRNGVLQPILLKDVNEDGYYEIIAGERRWRASLIAGLEEIPAIIKRYDNEDDVFVVSIIENIQRSDFLPIEEMDAYVKLSEKGYTHEQIGNLVGKSRSHITNILRLENLPSSIKEIINEGGISLGHAKALVQHPDPEKVISIIMNKELNVRQTEELIKRLNNNLESFNQYESSQRDENKSKNLISKKKNSQSFNEENFHYQKDQETLELENLVSGSINSKVSIEKDYIKVHYKDFEDLDRIINLLIGERI